MCVCVSIISQFSLFHCTCTTSILTLDGSLLIHNNTHLSNINKSNTERFIIILKIRKLLKLMFRLNCVFFSHKKAKKDSSLQHPTGKVEIYISFTNRGHQLYICASKLVICFNNSLFKAPKNI